MYGKIFESIYDGTLADHWQALITFQQMIVLCDSDGIIDMTPGAIARRTGIPIEHIELGIEVLERPDPCSRTEDEEGRRIVRLDEHREWGWRLVNHAYYRSLASREDKKKADRERIAAKRANTNGVAKCRKSSQSVADVAHTDTDTNTDTGKKKYKKKKAANSDDYSTDFLEFWKLYPKKTGKGAAFKTWEKIKSPKTVLSKIQLSLIWQKKSKEWTKNDGEFIPHPSTYLNQRRWEDEPDTPVTESSAYTQPECPGCKMMASNIIRGQSCPYCDTPIPEKPK